MGIELELHSERPAIRGWDSSRSTLLRGSYAHGEAPARVLGTFDRHGPGKLGWVDPYGDTLFNEQEAEAARQEAAALIRRCSDERQKAALLDLAELLEACAATPGSYLWFMGDQSQVRGGTPLCAVRPHRQKRRRVGLAALAHPRTPAASGRGLPARGLEGGRVAGA